MTITADVRRLAIRSGLVSIRYLVGGLMVGNLAAALVGGGLVGVLLGHYLARQHYPVAVKQEA